jgi:hypothetical protein
MDSKSLIPPDMLNVKKIRLLSEGVFRSQELRFFKLGYMNDSTPLYLLADDNLVNSKSLMTLIEQE